MSLDNLITRAKWQEEEDEGDDVKDNWEDEDEEPVKKPVVAESKPKANKKEANKKLNQQKDAGASDRPLSAQELREKRLQDEKLQRESEMKLTKQMLGMEDKDISLEFTLDTKEDFDKFHKNLVHKLWCYDKNPNYFLLIEKLFRDLCVPLEVDELKNLSSTVNALFNEKVKAKQTKPKKKITKGLAVKVERNNLDRNDYADELDDIM